MGHTGRVPREPYPGEVTDPACMPEGGGESWQLRLDRGEVPEDAPLGVLMLMASRLMGAFYGETVRSSGVRMSPALAC